jgi:propionate CoA-transferase
MITENRIEGYNLPQGVMAQLIREIAAHRPGLITRTGLYTYMDPRLTGGALNAISKRKVVDLIELRGQEYLFYPSFSIDVAFVRGTTADEDGNISMEEEVATFNMLSAAQAAHNNNGIVIAQVKRKVKRGSLDARTVKIPGTLVDYIVVEPNQWQTYLGEYNPGLCGAAKMVIERSDDRKLDERKVVCRRAARELVPGVINLGFGMSSGVADVAVEEGFYGDIALTIEQGAVGGVPTSGLIFGCSMNPQAILDQPYQFDFYDGGGIDCCCVGLAQADQHGNVNVSKFGDRIPGAGGFIDITQNAKAVVFCGTLTAGGLEVLINDGRVSIIREGKIRKFVREVEHITFSGRFAKTVGQPVLFVTERAVFRLDQDGLILVEIAPGIDLEREILSQMEFSPRVAQDLKEMDGRIFNPEPMGIREEILRKLPGVR